MLRNLIFLAFIYLFTTACALNSVHRGLASSPFDYENDEKVFLDGLEPYFPIGTNNQEITLNNRYNVDIKYKINSLGNLVLVKNKSTCVVSGQSGGFTTLKAQNSCTITIKTDKSKNIDDGELRVYKKSNNEQELIIREVVHLNTFDAEQCKTLIESTFRAQNPDTLHDYQCTIINNSCKPKPNFVKDCEILSSAKIKNHNNINLFKYCINQYYPDKKKQFISTEDNQLDHRSYHDYISNLADFDTETYCQDLEE